MRPRNDTTFNSVSPVRPDDISSPAEEPNRVRAAVISGSPVDVSLSISLALDERTKRKRKLVKQVQRSRSLSPYKTPTAYSLPLKEKIISDRSQNRASCNRTRCSESLLCSTVASRASSYFYAPPPHRPVHGPECSQIGPLQPPLRNQLDRLIAEGDELRRTRKVECKRCTSRRATSASRVTCRMKTTQPQGKAVIEYDPLTGRVVKGVSLHRTRASTGSTSKPAGASHTRSISGSLSPHNSRLRSRIGSRDDYSSSKQKGSKASKDSNITNSYADASGTMLAVSSNLQEVSFQLKQITNALSESLSLSMSLREGAASATPGQFSGVDLKSISPVRRSSSGRQNAAVTSLGFTDTNESNLAPRVLEETVDNRSDIFVSQNAGVVSDMIKSSIRKNLVQMFSS